MVEQHRYRYRYNSFNVIVYTYLLVLYKQQQINKQLLLQNEKLKARDWYWSRPLFRQHQRQKQQNIRDKRARKKAKAQWLALNSTPIA